MPPARPRPSAGAASVLGAVQLLAAVAGAAPAGVQLLPPAGEQVRFAVEVPAPRLVALEAQREIQNLWVEGYEVAAAPGEPALVERVVAVAVPSTGPVEVRGVGVETEWREGVRLAHLPWYSSDRERPGSGSAAFLAQIRGPDRARSQAPQVATARLVGLSWMRGQRIARIAIRPAFYDPATRRLGVHRRVEVEVGFAGGRSAPERAVAASDPFETIYEATLVNYQQGKAWRDPAAGAGLQAVTVVPDTSLYAGRRWVKIAVPRAGFYRVEFGQLRNSALFDRSDAVSIDSLRLFTWPGVPMLPEESYCDSCDYREVAIGIVDGGTAGVFDENTQDYFYFYALGPSDWTDVYAGPSDPPQPDSVFLNHPYETRNYYYLTIAQDDLPMPGPRRRISAVDATPVDTIGAVTPSTFTARAHFEQDLDYMPHATPITGFNPDASYRKTPEFWEKFFWTRIRNSSSDTFQGELELPGIESSLPARVRLRTWGTTSLREGDKAPGELDHFLDVTVGDVIFPRRGWNGLRPQTFDTTVVGLNPTGSSITAKVARDFPDPEGDRVDEVAIAWFDVFYPRRFEPVGNALGFDTDDPAGPVFYRIGPFTDSMSVPRVFDVTDPLTPIDLSKVEYLASVPGQFHMRFQPVGPGRRRYRILPDWPIGSGLVRVPNSDVVDAPSSSLENLRRGQRADFLLVYYDGFRAAADSLLRWRRDVLPLRGRSAPFDTLAVPISALYDQFSGGRTDPGAIRNFLRAAYFNWQVRPTFVTFLGDASYDFKDLQGAAAPGQPSVFIPAYDGGFDLAVQRHYATDDWTLNVDDPIRVVPDFLGGRIPAGDAAAALTYVRDKLIAYERTSPRGEWRDRVMLIADDNEQGSEIDFIYWGHLHQTTELDTAATHEVDRKYVYLHKYPDGPGDTKPGAKEDIIASLNEGVVLANYVGHGSSIKLADESVLLATDVDRLVNRDRPSILVAASCDVGRYDNPVVPSLGERLLLKAGGGTVGVISATELALSTQNARLNETLFQGLFRRDPSSGRFETTLAEALLVAKSGAVNSQKYQLMGDAAVRPALPRLAMEVTLHDLAGNQVAVAERGQTFEVRGRVLDRPGGTPQVVDGIVRLLIEDSAPIETPPACFGDCFEYRYQASPVFRGDVSVTGGFFQTRFVMPMNARLGSGGRSRAYSEIGSGVTATDGVGSDSFTVAAGAPPTDDREGPRIALSFVGGATRVRPDAMLRVDLVDPSGILITGNAAQNGIIVTMDDDPALRADITSSFRYAANSYQSGTAFFRLPSLAPGSHRIQVSAADNLAAGIVAADHRSTATIEFEVVVEPDLQVTRAILFPNPVRSGGPQSGGQFVVDAPGDSVDVMLRIYTVAGRQIRSLRSSAGQGQVQIPWDGLDAEGAPLARGVYLFKVQVLSRLGARQRAGAEGRLVVVGR